MSNANTALKDRYTLGPDKQYITDTSVMDDILQHQDDVVLRADPGTGKSVAALKTLGAPDHPFVFVADTIALADDLGSDHGLPVYYKGQPDPPDSDFITIPHHAHKFADPNITLVVDEWHSLITAYGYKQTVIDQLVDSFSEYGQIIGLTGTYVPVPHQHVHVEVDQDRPPITIEHVTYKHLWSAIIDQVEARPEKTHFISLYDKGAALDNLTTLLEERGFDSDGITHFNADTKDGEEQQELIEKNVTRGDTEVVVSTYVQGFSIKDDDYMVHIAPLPPNRMHSAQHIAQVAQRFRNVTELPINLYWNFPRPGSVSLIDGKTYAKKQREMADDKIQGLRKNLQLQDGDDPSEGQKRMIGALINRQNGEATAEDEVNLVRRDLSRNEYQIHHNIYKLERDNIYKRKRYMNSWLERYGLTIGDRVDCPMKLPEAKSLSSTAGSAHGKKVDKDEFEDRIDEHLDKDAINRTDEVASKILFLKQYYRNEDDIRTLVLEHGKSSKTWNKLKRQIHAQAPLTELGAHQRNLLLLAFEVGETLTNDEIRSRLQALNPPVMQTSELSKQQAVRRLRQHFELKRTTELREGDRTTVYRIESDDPLPVPLSDGVTTLMIGEKTFRMGPSFS